MLARIPSGLLRAVTRAFVHSALSLVVPSLAIAATSLGPYVWPADGAPVCNAGGDQHALFFSVAACNNMAFGWIDASASADTLAQGNVGPIPPTGDCASSYHRVNAPGAAEVSAAEVRTPLIAVALPGCFGPLSPAFLWKQGSGAASQLVLDNPYWLVAQQRAVVDDGDFARHHPRLAGSGALVPDTALVAVWSDDRTGVAQIRAQRVDWKGQRQGGPAGMLIAPTGAAQTDPEITRLPDGGVLVIWLDARSGGSDVYALKLLPDGSVAPGWPATGLAFEARPEAASSPRLVHHDTSYPTFAVWEESGPRFAGGRSIVVRKLAPDGLPDPAWDPLGVVLSSSATVEHLEDVDLMADGLVAVWTDTRAATGANPTDLYAQRIEGSGAIAGGWPASGLAICTASGRQDAARVSAGSSYAAFAWTDRRGADADIYAELRFANGTLPLGLWVANGLAATSAAGDQTGPVVGVGNGGGCFVAWEDARDIATTGLDIYAQAFTSEGDRLDVPPSGPPHAIRLGTPRPNPMRNSTVFTLELPRAGTARVDVLDVAGRHVRTLAARDYDAGLHELVFDGRDDTGRELPAGLFHVRARVGDATSSRAIVRIH
jgi:hypothetical protein